MSWLLLLLWSPEQFAGSTQIEDIRTCAPVFTVGISFSFHHVKIRSRWRLIFYVAWNGRVSIDSHQFNGVIQMRTSRGGFPANLMPSGRNSFIALLFPKFRIAKAQVVKSNLKRSLSNPLRLLCENNDFTL